ncbi:efflux RND transporter permease subunit [Sulfuriferula nivalis]|uniref:Acriflavin resistance protein n=1 Tax=Sulfuriferula nivalis TaxID=2675298 RepID=A0A809RH35_9PROT|nr:efflux RND transporter permease subunit [Sulfuriferula nivalis]BBP01189.1 acriflavin resistance protein [Sulfuriferula nivalis]
MNISAWAIRQPIPAILLFALLTLLGLHSFQRMGIQDFPDIELPVVTVTTTLEGASPSQLETDVARKIENTLATLGGVKHIRSVITDGSSLTYAEFNLEKDTSEAVNDVRDAVSRVRADLPGDIKDPIISKVTTTGRPIITFSIASAQMDEEALSWYVDNNLSKLLLAIPGVGKVDRVGGVDREIRITLNPAKLAALHVTAADVSRQIKRVEIESSGGRGDVGQVEQAIRIVGTVSSAQALAATSIPLSNGRYVRLDQIADVQDTHAERRSLALLNGKPVVGFEVTRMKGTSEVEVAAKVRAAIMQLTQHQSNLHIAEVYDGVTAVQDSYDGSMDLLYEGAILAILVVWWFLRDLRATLVAATALPLSVIPTFIGMYYFGFSLNTVTLLALALVVGILVDDAIVEIENIVRHLRMGKSPLQAALEATNEIGLAVVATTATLVAVFLPTAFMDGVAGKFFKQFGWTAALAVMASLLVARLLTPMMAAYLLKPLPAKAHESALMQRYLTLVQWCLRHRIGTSIAAAVFFFASIALIPLLPSGFVPPGDRGQTFVSLELAPGTPLALTRERAEMARLDLVSIPEIKQIYTSIGGGSGGGDLFSSGASTEVRKAKLTVSLTPRNQRSRTQQDIEAEIRQRLATIPGVRITVGSGDAGEKLQLVLSGDDANLLAVTSQLVVRDIRTLPGLGNVSSSASLLRPEIIIQPDYARAAELGVTTANLADTVRIATSGDYSAALAKLNLSERQIPIRARLPDSIRQNLDSIGQLSVPGKNGDVQLANIAHITMGSGAAQIDRLDRNRNVTIDVELNGQQLGDVFKAVEQLPSMQHLPPGVFRSDSGDAERMQELFGSFGLAMMTGVLLVYFTLVLLFHDFAQPVSILAALPLAFGGAFAALYLTGSSFSMPSLIGLLMLMGIVTKNSILLVEYAIVARRDHGMSRHDAIVDACSKRARPILMTTIAMGAGMLPIALGLGVDPSFRAPMAIAVIGGLITSTLLSLLIIPVVYTYVDDVTMILKKWTHRRNGVLR